MIVLDTYLQTCRRIGEPNGLQLGILSESDWLNFLNQTTTDFLESGEFKQSLIEVAYTPGVGAVPPAQVMEVRHVFYDGNALSHTSRMGVDEFGFSGTTPEVWYESGQSDHMIQIHPEPSSAGTIQIIATCKPEQPATDILTDTIPEIPRILAMYVKWGILQRIWSSHAELKNMQLAQFARARYTEGINAVKAIMGEAIDSE